jgi:hypothetical protein
MYKSRLFLTPVALALAVVAIAVFLTPEQALAAVLSAEHGGSSLASGGLSAAALASLPFLIGDTNQVTAEQLRAKRAEALARGQAIIDKGIADKRGLTADEQRDYDAAVAEVRKLDADLLALAPPATVPTAPDTASIARAAAEAERKRAADIRTRCKGVNLPDEFADGLIERGVASEHVGNLIVDELARRGGGQARPGGGTSVGRSSEDPAEQRAAVVEALCARATGHLPASLRFEPTDRSREFGSMPMLGMLAHYAGQRGERLSPHMAPAALFDRLVSLRSLSTSDFPIILADAGNKLLQKAYAQANVTYRLVFARKTFRDFKPHNFIRGGDFPPLLEKGETGEFKYGSMGEAKQALTMVTYGRIVGVSRRILVNDDLGAFADLPMKAGRRVADFENATAWAVPVAGGDGPTITETGRALFNTTDKTKASANAAISVAAVGIGRAAMMNQKGIESKASAADGIKLNITPKYLVTGPDKFTEAESFCNVNIVATQDSAANPFKGRLIPVGDANLTGNAWYLFADPVDLETLVYGYLEGQEGPQLMTREGFTSDGVDLRVALDFVAGALDYRGGFKNAGA